MVITSDRFINHISFIGGPEFCEEKPPKEYTFKETENPTISFTLCGVPKPSVTWKFNRGLIREVNLVRNSYYAYRCNITLPKLRRPVCKGYISIKADGFLNYGHQMNIKVPVFSECK